MDIRIAYAAGFFDGEGCISMSVIKHRNYPYPFYSMRVSATQVKRHVAPLLLLRDLFGGTVTPAKGRTSNQKPQMVWRLGGKKAHAAVLAMFPYFTVKDKVAGLALLFWTWKEVGQKAGSNFTLLDHEVMATLKDVVAFYNGHPQGVAQGLPEALAEGGEENGSRHQAIH